MESLNQMKFLENSSEIAGWRNYLGYKLLKDNRALPGLLGSICEHQPRHRQTWKADSEEKSHRGRQAHVPARWVSPCCCFSEDNWRLWVPLFVVKVHIDLYNWKAPTHDKHLAPAFILVQNHRILSKSAKQNFLNIHFQFKPPIMGVWNLLPL